MKFQLDVSLPYSDWAFWPSPDRGGGGVGVRRPFHFLKTIEDIDTNYA